MIKKVLHTLFPVVLLSLSCGLLEPEKKADISISIDSIGVVIIGGKAGVVSGRIESTVPITNVSWQILDFWNGPMGADFITAYYNNEYSGRTTVDLEKDLNMRIATAPWFWSGTFKLILTVHAGEAEKTFSKDFTARKSYASTVNVLMDSLSDVVINGKPGLVYGSVKADSELSAITMNVFDSTGHEADSFFAVTFNDSTYQYFTTVDLQTGLKTTITADSLAPCGTYSLMLSAWSGSIHDSSSFTFRVRGSPTFITVSIDSITSAIADATPGKVYGSIVSDSECSAISMRIADSAGKPVDEAFFETTFKTNLDSMRYDLSRDLNALVKAQFPVPSGTYTLTIVARSGSLKDSSSRKFTVRYGSPTFLDVKIDSIEPISVNDFTTISGMIEADSILTKVVMTVLDTNQKKVPDSLISVSFDSLNIDTKKADMLGGLKTKVTAHPGAAPGFYSVKVMAWSDTIKDSAARIFRVIDSATFMLDTGTMSIGASTDSGIGGVMDLDFGRIVFLNDAVLPGSGADLVGFYAVSQDSFMLVNPAYAKDSLDIGAFKEWQEPNRTQFHKVSVAFDSIINRAGIRKLFDSTNIVNKALAIPGDVFVAKTDNERYVLIKLISYDKNERGGSLFKFRK